LLRNTVPDEEPGPIVRTAGWDHADRTIRYRVDGEIARGGMGSVLKGRDPDLGRDVTLKVLREDLRDNADMVRRFVEEALEAEPKLGDDRQAELRFTACASALAANGAGAGETQPDEVAKTKLRGQSLGWLKAELDAWSKLLESGTPQASSTIVHTLKRWKVDTDLTGVRDALVKLPEAERKQWQALWSDVETLLHRAAGQTP